MQEPATPAGAAAAPLARGVADGVHGVHPEASSREVDGDVKHAGRASVAVQAFESPFACDVLSGLAWEVARPSINSGESLIILRCND